MSVALPSLVPTLLVGIGEVVAAFLARTTAIAMLFTTWRPGRPADAPCRLERQLQNF